jgi:hypothetical protein
VAEADWPAALRGETPEIYICGGRDLKPHGFSLTARVLDFPDGMPGDISLFLTWCNRPGRVASGRGPTAPHLRLRISIESALVREQFGV